MTYQGLREWLDRVDELGELKRIDGAHWDQEIGYLRYLARTKNCPGPAVLFDNIVDYPQGYRVLTGAACNINRIGLCLNIEEQFGLNDWMPFVRTVKTKLKELTPIPAREVNTGPVLENVDEGDKIDLFKFPTPKWHKGDGARYIGTGDLIITRDPEEGWVNVGTYRTSIADNKTLLTYIDPGRHGRLHREKYFRQGKPCPVVVVVGHDPLLHVAAGNEIPYGVSEFDWCGGIKGEAVDVITGAYTGLPIPADAEIAIEGEWLPDESRIEGPFAEFTGYYGSGSRPEPVMRIKRVLYRNDPIILGLMNAGRSRSGYASGRIDHRSVLRSALIWNELEGAGIPGVTGVWCNTAGGTTMLIAVSVKQMYPGHAKQVGAIASQCHAGAQLGRYVFVLDDDVDPSYDFDVLWSLATRSDPERSIDILRHCWSGPLDMAIPIEERGFNSRAIIECCRPFDRYNKYAEWAQFPRTLRTDLEKKFGSSIYE